MLSKLFSGASTQMSSVERSSSSGVARYTYAPLPQDVCSNAFDAYKHQPLDRTRALSIALLPEQPSQDFTNRVECATIADTALDSNQIMDHMMRQLIQQLALAPLDELIGAGGGSGRGASCDAHSMKYCEAFQKPASERKDMADMRCQAEVLEVEQWTLQPPPLLVGHKGGALRVSPNALFWWEKAALQPVSIQKQLAYLVLCPVGMPFGTVSLFCQQLEVAFQQCRLGSLTRFEGQWLHLYSAIINSHHVGTQDIHTSVQSLNVLLQQRWRPSQRLVVFCVHDTCREGEPSSFARLLCALSKMMQPSKGRPLPILQLVHSAQVHRQLCFREIVFSVFAKSRAAESSCSRTQLRRHQPPQEPLFVLPPFASLRTLRTPRGLNHLHCSYTVAGFGSGEHICFCWIDCRGTTFDAVCLPCAGKSCKQLVQLVWDHGAQLRGEQVSVMHVAVLKWGDLSEAEAVAWRAVVGSLYWPTSGMSVGAVAKSFSLLSACTTTWAHFCGVPLSKSTIFPADACAMSRTAVQLSISRHPSDWSRRKAFLLLSSLILQLDVRLHLGHCGGVDGHRDPECRGDGDESTPPDMLVAIVAELYTLSWLTATPCTGSEVLPLHCAIVDRLANLVTWVGAKCPAC